MTFNDLDIKRIENAMATFLAKRKVPDWEWKHKDVRTKANCAACHSDAERGYYED